ncbi:DUF563 domain-containing protein [Granulicella sp. S190]|jgi:capsular polysaccharide biosynthesis protein|uniref:glycosyltransferase family 61 protein n=1 Tax=Granulicella sp. S190 TaxID=1747226 RepID=UPI00131D3775|nr:glycosyltransferase family 61 protein [Granulicella sp. S190]
MQQPYGPGLAIVPQRFLEKLAWGTKKVIRRAERGLLKPFDRLGLDKFRVSKLIWVKDRIGQEVGNYRVLHESRTVDVSLPADLEFLRSVKNYNSGEIKLGEVFVCEISPAVYYPHLGLVANKNFEVFGDSVLLPHRFQLSPAYRSFRPSNTTHHAGTVSTIQRIDAYSFWHWFADCLPQLLTLEKYIGDKPLTLLVSDDLGGFQRETLALMLPPTMSVKVVPAKKWISADHFLLPSYLSGKCNGYLPDGYYDEIRRRITQGLGLQQAAPRNLRIYLSRSGARRRRIANEPELLELLASYGFIEVRPETMSLREQVDIFQRAEVIAGPHGAALGGMVFAPHSKLLVLYPEQKPGEYFYTMARCLDIEHYGATHNCFDDEDCVDDFTVDLVKISALLSGPMGLNKN